jgi:hypothetical protein
MDAPALRRLAFVDLAKRARVREPQRAARRGQMRREKIAVIRGGGEAMFLIL